MTWGVISTITVFLYNTPGQQHKEKPCAPNSIRGGAWLYNLQFQNSGYELSENKYSLSELN